MGRHRTPEEKEAFREEAVAMRRAGIGARRIAEALGIGGELVRELLRGEPPPASLSRPNAKDELREVASALRRDGRTYNEIRDELGVSKSSLSLWLRDQDFPTDDQRAAVRSGQAGAEPQDDLPPRAEVAREMRRGGWLLREIAEELGVCAATAMRWCTGLPAPARAVHGRSPEETRAMARAYWDAELERRDVVRQRLIATSRERVGALTEREVDLVVAVAYWCEGAKSKPWQRREMLSFINSDADVIRLFVAWLSRRDVPLSQCRLCVNIHESGDLQEATRYWADVLQCPTDAFAKPTIKRHNPKTVRKNTGAEYRGCLSISVRQSRDLYREIEGLWRGIAGFLAGGRPVDAAD